MKILVVEDEPKVAAFVKQGLEEQHYTVDVADNGAAGLDLFNHSKYDIIILDVLLPVLTGVELCERIRKENDTVPILLLTALGTTEDKVKGFEAGADDYLVKPFEFVELLIRIKALTKRNAPANDKATYLEVADLRLDLEKKVALRGGKNIILTSREFALLEYLMRNNGRLVSRIDISEKVWDINFDTGTNVVDVYINILRKKIDKDFPKKLIHTRIGMGYMMNPEV